MPKRFTYLLLLVFVSGILSTCKKYPEGPLISLRSKTERITGGWQVETFLVNGIDSTAEVPKDTFNANATCFFTFCPCSDTKREKTITVCTGNEGIWDFKDSKKDILIIDILGSSGIFFYPFVSAERTEWKIMRLTNKEMWLKVMISNNEYYVKYKKIVDH